MMSFIHALADSYGYDSEKDVVTGLTAKQTFLQGLNVTYVNDANQVPVTSADTEGSIIDFVKSISASVKPLEGFQRNMTFHAFGDDGSFSK